MSHVGVIVIALRPDPRIVATLLIAVLVVGCSAGRSLPSPTAAPDTPTVEPTLSQPSPATPDPTHDPTSHPIQAPTPSPTAPWTPSGELGSGEPTARGEVDGIVVELWLDRRDVDAGGRVQALARVTNEGDTVVYREENVCGTGPAPVTVEGSWGLPAGESWTGVAAEFKRQVLAAEGALPHGRSRIGGFVDAARIDDDSVLCFLPSIIGPFRPGDSARMRLAWDAIAPEGRVIPAGTAYVRATFESWTDRDTRQHAPAISAETTIEIGHGPTPALTIVDYVDAALADPEFSAWLEERPMSSWINPLVTYWPNGEGVYPAMPEYEGVTDGAVDVGLARFGDEYEEVAVAVIDATDASVLGVRYQD
jgi:hypothetical protein